MLTLISCDFCEPPSSTSCFRDVTLYSKIFLKSEVLLECDKEYVDLYWKWLKKRGAWDFITDIIDEGSERGISIRTSGGAINVDRIYYDNLNLVLSRLKQFHSS